MRPEETAAALPTDTLRWAMTHDCEKAMHHAEAAALLRRHADRTRPDDGGDDLRTLAEDHQRMSDHYHGNTLAYAAELRKRTAEDEDAAAANER